MSVENTLTENFSCAKCRAKSGYVRETRLPANGLRQLVKEGEISVKYYALTCGLCGYTELYDSRVFATQPEAVGQEAAAVQKL